MKQKNTCIRKCADKKRSDMNKAFILLGICLTTIASFGQSLQRTVFNSTGGVIGQPGSVQMLLSVGEPIIGMSGNQEAYLAQGFLGGSKSVAPSPSGIEDQDADKAVVYPNPFSSRIMIRTTVENLQVAVFNTIGQQVYSGANEGEAIDLSQLAPGIYMLHLYTKQTTISNTKILKQ